MIVTFPRFGYTAEIMALFFEEMGIQCVRPPLNDKTIVKTGSDISPEEMCLPFKYMAGDLAEAYKAGADTAVMIATCGPCRLGEYGELLRTVLEKAGYSYEWIMLDSPAVTGIKEFIKRLDMITGSDRVKTMMCAVKAVKLIRRIESAERRLKRINGYTVKRGICAELLKELKSATISWRTFDEGFDYIDGLNRKISGLKTDKAADPVRLLIAGEIYTSIENDSNGRLEEKLMGMGCSIERHMTVSWWVKNTLKRLFIPQRRVYRNRNSCFAYEIGGYAKDTVKKISSCDNADGVIKIMPAGCMPEIVTKAYCEKLQKEKDIRILNLIYDEMSGEAGYETRLEAFTDILERRKHVLDVHRHRFDKH